MKIRPYDLLAKSYDTTEPKLFEWAARETARVAWPDESDDVLDVGTGPGHALLAIPHVRKAIGVDRSPLMVRRARAAGVNAIVADAESLPFETGSFDLVLATSVLPLLSPEGGHWDEISRVLRPGGRCVANFWLPVRDERWQWLEAHFNQIEDSEQEIERVDQRMARAGLDAPTILAVRSRSVLFTSPAHFVKWQLSNGLGLSLLMGGQAETERFSARAEQALSHYPGGITRDFRIMVRQFGKF